MAQSISISSQSNNSLGECWLLKHENDFTGELYDKELYPKSDFSAYDAFKEFVDGNVGDDMIDVEDIFVMDDAESDVELASYAATYGARYAVEYRSMVTALHHLIVFTSWEDAYDCDRFASEAEGMEFGLPESFTASANAGEDYEIDYRDIEHLSLPNGDSWRSYIDVSGKTILIVNDFAYDLYI